MSGLRGVLLGTLGLTMLEAIVSSKQASANAGTAITLITGGINRLVDPSVPLVPDRRPDAQKPRIVAN